MHTIKKRYFFNNYKISKVGADTFTKNYVYNKTDKEKKLFQRNTGNTGKDIREKSGGQNIYDLVDKEIKGKCVTKFYEIKN